MLATKKYVTERFVSNNKRNGGMKMNTKNITLYSSTNRREQANNPKGFNNAITIPCGDTEQLAKAVTWDNCTAQYKDGYRKTENFLQADCILADIDNTHSDIETEWITPEDVQSTLPDVAFYYYPSRNHMKQKDDKKPRPKYHLIFPTDKLNSATEYTSIAKTLIESFPQLHFDSNVKGAAQLNFGVANPVVSYVDGSQIITDYILSIRQKTPEQTPDTKSTDTSVIPQGQRNTTLHEFALHILTRYGETEETYNSYLKESQKCSPQLEQKEVETIWNGAVDFYNSTIKTQPGYIPPSLYNNRNSTPPQWELPLKDAVAVQQLYNIDKRDHKFSIKIARLILKAIGVTIRYNDMSHRIEVDGIPEKYGKNDLNNLLVTLVSDIANELSYKRATSNVVHETLTAIASENHYHPVLSLLQEQDWDNVDRLPTIYAILGLTDHNYQTLFRKWAIQTIAILFNSDSTSITTEGVLVLQGKQGIGKTQFFRHLAIQDSFFKGGATLDMSNKDSVMSATKVWICELGEIDSTTKKEQSALKAFLTETTDRYREPYARCESIRPRRTSFCGTVNPQYYLRDETGNRRFWTVPVKKINLQKVFELSPEWYTQFWRQILSMYLDNPKERFLTMEETAFVNQNNQEYEQLAFGEDEFLTCFDMNADKNNWTWMSAAQVADLLNERFHSLHITSVKIGKLINRIEHTANIRFQRKTLHGSRLILCPPHSSCGRTFATSDKQDSVPFISESTAEEETVAF